MSRRGFTLIELLIVIAIVGLIASIALPNLLSSRKAANEASAVASMRAIHAAQSQYKDRDMKVGQTAYALNLEELVEAGLLDESFADDLREGYDFGIVRASDTDWEARTRPQAFDKTGDRSFLIGTDGYLFFTTATNPAALPLSAWLPLGE